MSRPRNNKSTTDFPSGSGSGSGGSHSRDRSDARVLVELDTATETLQGGSFNYRKV